MTILCPACGGAIQVPDYWAAKPELRVKCKCGSAVTLGAAQRLAASPSPQPASTPAAATVPTAPAPTAPVAVASVGTQTAPVPVSAAAALAEVETTATPTRPRWAAPAPVPQTAGAAPAIPRPTYRVHWRRCASHSSTPSTTVCPTCTLGYCQDCEKRVQNVMICPACSNLCITADDYANLVDLERRRARPLLDDLGPTVGHPPRHPL